MKEPHEAQRQPVVLFIAQVVREMMFHLLHVNLRLEQPVEQYEPVDPRMVHLLHHIQAPGVTVKALANGGDVSPRT